MARARNDQDWWRGAAVYQIYPRSFADSDDDGIGDLRGILDRLPYIVSLGVDAVWLCPFYPSPGKDFGYDISDYCDVDPLFGSLADVKALIGAFHDAGVKVILDQVYSHTSDRHPWFAESRRSRQGPRADWYVWSDPKPDGGPPNNWLSVFGGSAWSWEPRRAQYYLHNFLTEQPDLNLFNPQVKDQILEVAKFWLDLGVDGLRLDVANYFCHDPLLRDNPPNPTPRDRTRPYCYQRHLYNRSRPEALDVARELRSVIDAYPDRMAVAEIFSDAHVERAMDYTRDANLLHTAYGFAFLESSALTGGLIRETLEPWSRADAWPSWSFSNHDVARAVSRWDGEPDDGGAFAKMLMALLVCLRGTIFVYQGDELGLRQAKVPFEKLQDPEGIRFWPHSLGRDGARTPMPWDRGAPYAGFSAAEPWLPVDPQHAEHTVDLQESDPGSVLHFARQALKTRAARPALRRGDITFLIADDDRLAFTRSARKSDVLCLFNLSKEERSFEDVGASAGRHILLNSTTALRGGEPNLILPGRSAVVLER